MFTEATLIEYFPSNLTFKLALNLFFDEKALKSFFVVFVPNVNFDLIVYSKEFGPISISAKTSLRERYKQADLEAVSLKYVHRKARCYLVTMDKLEAMRLEKKLKEGDLLGIDDIVLGDEISFDEMIEFLSSINLEKPKAVEIITSSQIYEIVKN